MQWRFWRWLFCGLESKRPGIFQLFDAWLVFHILIAILIQATITIPIEDAASKVLLPLASIFIGLSFAWAGNAQALMQEKEIVDLAEKHPDGLETYLYTFQLAILIILFTLIIWGLAGLEFLKLADHHNIPYVRNVIEVALIFFASMTIRECWHVVLGSQLMILSRHEIRRSKKTRNDD
ncbi:hypothetical protein L2D01_05405 [Hyphomonadaceae bacterium ML37]|nr:hypothetical protein L2D01_05405 [Hyphomonadaceae bacterium ML37]